MILYYVHILHLTFSYSLLISIANSFYYLKKMLHDIQVRNASIRSALPPPSPTPSRYWDRETSTRSSLLSSSRNLSSDDYGKSSSSTLNSTLDDKTHNEGKYILYFIFKKKIFLYTIMTYLSFFGIVKCECSFRQAVCFCFRIQIFYLF